MRIAISLILLPILVTCIDEEDNFKAFVRLHGNKDHITRMQLENLVNGIGYNKSPYQQQILDKANNCTNCRIQCQNVSTILLKANMATHKTLNWSQIESLAPQLLLRLQNPFCDLAIDQKMNKSTQAPPAIAVWGYSFLMVTIINCCALLGFTFAPFMGRRVYKLIMAFMISLAVGSLAGSAVLFLLPDALRLSELEEALPDSVSYVWKSTVVMGGIYMFFLLERFLKYMIGRRGRLAAMKNDASCSMNIRRMPDADAALKEMPQRSDPCGEATSSVEEEKNDDEQVTFSPASLHAARPSTTHTEELAPLCINGKEQQDHVLVSANGDVGNRPNGNARLTRIAPVAWMIIFGDGVHNFIDGLSIGAAFSHNIVSGFSLSVAVLCEELPHELGDFAILLNSGMSIKMALLANFLSACMCYFGLVLGILIGEHTDSAVFVFAVAAGMFLYISLVDMMPEVIQLMESEDAKSLGRVKIFIIQNIGLFMGYGILLLMALYGDKITFA